MNYTVRRCCEDWLTSGLPGRHVKTVEKNRYVLEPLLAVIGTVRLRDLDVTDVDKALAALAASRSSSTVAMAHLALTWAITRAQAKNLVLRNASPLTGTPPGQEGRPASVAVWRSASADTKTKTSRRTLALPELAVVALQALHAKSQPAPGTWCSPPRPGSRWTRRRCAGSSAPSALLLGSGPVGHRGSCGTHS